MIRVRVMEQTPEGDQRVGVWELPELPRTGDVLMTAAGKFQVHESVPYWFLNHGIPDSGNGAPGSLHEVLIRVRRRGD